MISNIPREVLESLTVRDIEQLLAWKRENTQLAELLRERDRLRLELKHIEDSIDALEKFTRETAPAERAVEDAGPARSFLAGKKKRNLKDYIAQVLLEAGEPLSPSEIQRRLPEAGYESSSTNPRSFYNTVFQALQRYEAFRKAGRKYGLSSDMAQGETQLREILPKNKTRLKDFIIEVLSEASSPLKVSEIASRVIIAGYHTDLSMDELTQRVSATMKKYLNSDFEWDSQRYRLVQRN